MNVAVVNSGPGVICPTATASRSWASVSHPSRSTRSARRNASRTEPLPNSTEPIFRKTRKSGQSANATPAAAGAVAAPVKSSGMNAETPACLRSIAQRQRATAMPAGEQDRELVDSQEAGRQRADCDEPEKAGLHRRLAESPKGLDHHGDDHGFDPVEHCQGLRQRAEADVGPGDRADDQGRG